MSFDLSPTEMSAMSGNFLALLNDHHGIGKLAQTTESFLRVKLREVSFAWQVLPPVTVDDSVLDRSTDHDTLVKIEELEPDSTATTLNFRGRADISYIRQRRYAIPFWTVSSARFQKEEAELRASRSPLTKIIEENSLLDLQGQIDDTWMFYCRDAVTQTGMEVVNDVDDALSTAFLARIFKRMLAERRKVSVLLMTQILWQDILAWGSEEAGTNWVSDKTTKGVPGDQLLGYRVITTIKNDLVQANEVWAYTEPRFLGHSFILENPKFWVNKDGRLIEMEAYMDIGFGIGNIYSIVRGELGRLDPVTGLPTS
jgi:hypothetical protein